MNTTRADAVRRFALPMLAIAAFAMPPTSAAAPSDRLASCLADLSNPPEVILDGSGGPADELELPLIPTSAVWSVLAGPLIPAPGTDGKIHVAYELLFTNVAPEPVRIESLQVVDPSRGNTNVGTYRIFAVDGKEITGLFRRFSLRRMTLTSADYSNELGPGQAAVVYMNVTLNSAGEVPKVIAHRVALSRGKTAADPPGGTTYPDPPVTAVAACSKVSKPEPVVIAPPLRGDRWVNGNGCCAVIGPHRHVILPANGTLRPPEHFAIDYLQLDAAGYVYDGDPKVLENWHFYGVDVVSVAAGVVVRKTDGLPDQVPLQEPVGITIDTAEGNSVIVDLGHGRFAAYAHLIPGSIPVQIGDRVKRGQRLGYLGNSGSSSAPHLHFQISDRPSFLDSIGLPFVFDRMELQGRLVGATDDVLDQIFERRLPTVDTSVTGVRREQMPLTLDLMGYR